MITRIFFELIQIAIGHKTEFSHTPTEEEWRELFVLAKRQTLLGVGYVAVEKLGAEQRPPREILLKWFAAAECIRMANDRIAKKAKEIAESFKKDGFRNVILKGQGIAEYYRDAGLEGRRTPGDLDIWLDGNREDITAYVRRWKPDCKPVYHHVDFPEVDGVEVEVHYMPSWMNCYFTNRVLQRWFETERIVQFGNGCGCAGIPMPTLAFNRLYILVHIYRHLFGEGIGLRQLMDYYFVLCQGFTEEERRDTIAMLASLKMGRFAGAVMWVLQEVFGMEERYLLVEPDEGEGCFLLNEILVAGNFGRYDPRIKRVAAESELSVFVRRVIRNFRFVSSYPSEVIWSPIFKLWHFFWRKGIEDVLGGGR